MILSHKIRLNPTADQEAYFRRACGVVRFVYNWGLAEWIRQYEAGQKPNALALKKQYNAIKDEQFPWVREVSGRCGEYAFTRLGIAFKNFFEGCKGGRAVGYPKFKSKRDSHHSFYVANTELKLDGHWLRIPRVASWINMAEILRFQGKIMAGVISTDGQRWWIAITVEMPVPAAANQGQPVGVDLGIHNAAVLSNGRAYDAQKNLGRMLRKLRRINRELSRRTPGSAGWLHTKNKLNRLHYKIRCRREDAAHKMTTEIAKSSSIIGVEDLNVAGMLQNSRLSRSLSDVGMGEIVRQLEYKATLHGGICQRVGRFFPSSKLCHSCGWKNDELTLSHRYWTCQQCGSTHQRDLNAAINLRNEAVRLVEERRRSSHPETTKTGLEKRNRSAKGQPMPGIILS